MDLVKHSPIATNRGILVNDRMETNVEHVYAAGDVAEWNGEVAGLWAPAMDQGKVAGKNMVNSSTPIKRPFLLLYLMLLILRYFQWDS